MSLAKQQGGHS